MKKNNPPFSSIDALRFLPIIGLLMFSAALGATGCGGTCTYNIGGGNPLVSWTLDPQCNGNNFDHPTAVAQAGALSWPCGSGLVSCNPPTSATGSMTWTSTQPASPLTGAYAQGNYRDATGTIVTGTQIACTGIGGSGGGGGLPPAGCGGTCTYYPTGGNILVSWTMDPTCNNNVFDHPSAFATAGSMTYLCDSSMASCILSNQGYMTWTSTASRPTLTSAYVQGLYRTVTGTNVPGIQIFCNQNGGGGGPGPTPTCGSVQVQLNGPNALPGGVFYGYNWTQGWIDQCQTTGQPCGMVPSMFVAALCVEQGTALYIQCPGTPTWTVNKGSLQMDPVSQLPTNQFWKSDNTAGSVGISATVAGCAVPSAISNFYEHIINACAISPSSAQVPTQSTQTFSIACKDETGGAAPCQYRLGLRAEPQVGPSPILGTLLPDQIDTSTTQSTLTTTAFDVAGKITAGGPTFSCEAPVTVGNPAIACTISPASLNLAVGANANINVQCTGQNGQPANCPNMNWFSGPFLGPVNNGVFTAQFLGSTQLQAQSPPGTQPFQCAIPVTVTNGQTSPATACTISPSPINLLVGGTTNVNFQCTSSNGQPANCPPMNWMANPASLGSMAGNLFSAASTGTGTLQAQTQPGTVPTPFSCSVPLMVNPINTNPAVSCTISPPSLNLNVGASANLALQCKDINALAANCPVMKWAVNQPALGSIIGTQINTLTAGTGTIQAQTQAVPPAPTFSCSIPLTVTNGVRCNTLPTHANFPGQTTDFAAVLQSLGHLEAVPNMVLDNAQVKLTYVSPVRACGQDFDGAMRTAPGFIAVDSSRFNETITHPVLPLTITMKNLPYAQMPKLLVFDGYANDTAQVRNQGSDCVTLNRCTNLAYDFTTHTLTFQTAGFSSYATQDSSTPTTGNDAQFITQTPPPATMNPGQTVSVSLTFKNNGSSTWVDNDGTTSGVYRMALTRQNQQVNPADPTYTIWRANPLFLSAGETIPPGASKTFAFPITAPTSNGVYHFQWQMAQQNVGGFGEFSPDLAITVGNIITITPPPAPNRPAAFVKLTCPSNLVVASNITLGTLSLSFGQPSCNPAVRLDVTNPKNQPVDVSNLGCINGQSAFDMNTTMDGTYSANASYNGSYDRCLFAIAGTPPQATPELGPIFIVAVGLVAAMLVRNKTD